MNNLINLQIINSNSHFLYNIFLKLHNLFNSKSNLNDFTIKSSSDIEILSFLKQSYHSNNLLLQFINNNKLYLLQNINHNIQIFFLNKNNKIIKYLTYIYLITLLLKKLHNISHNILIIWIPIHINRDFNFDIINKSNLNISNNNFTAFVASGFTTSFTHNNIPKKLSVITRFEEIHKLLIHELIHNFCLDGSCHHSEQSNNISTYNSIKNPKNYNYEFSIYESYTELLSSYYQIIFFILFFKSNNSNFNNKKFITNLISKFIIKELLYSYNLISNLIKLNNYSSISQFIQNPVFIGDICFYEYYFIKALLYNNFTLSNSDFISIYTEIINIPKSDPLLPFIFNHKFKKITNFKYCSLSLL